MKKNLFVLVSVLLLLSVLLGACQAGTKKVRVASDATWPPFEMTDENTKEIIGFDVDLMKAIAQKSGLQVEFINVPFDSLLAGISQCQYDAAISAITITEERKSSMAFSDPYFAAGQVVTVNIDNTDINSKDDLVGKKVSAQIGTTGEIEGQKISNVTYKGYDSIDLAFLDVMNHQMDAVIADNPLAVGYVGKNSSKLKIVGSAFTDENYGIAVCNKNTDLLTKINAGLAAVKAEGLIEQLTIKWLVGN
jgi:polar amino acid transport system substrate-binding protein